MFKITYQVSTWLEMQRMGLAQWQQCLAAAKPLVDEVRRLLQAYAATGDKALKAQADAAKRKLPGACFQASEFALSVGTKKYNHGRKGHWREQRYAYLSGLAVIDADHCGNPRTLYERLATEHDLKALGILLVYVSASGEGLKIVFKAREEWGNLISNQYEMASLLGILDYVDDACKDSSRLSFITGPDDVLYLDADELFAADTTDVFPALEEEERTAYDLRYGERYRMAPKGDSSPTVQKWVDFEAERSKNKRCGRPDVAATQDSVTASTEASSTQSPTTASTGASSTQGSATAAVAATAPAVQPPALTERESAIVAALNNHYGESLPEGRRHETWLSETAPWLLLLTDNNAQKALAMGRQLSYVQNWKDQAPGELESCIDTVQRKPLLTRRPKRLQELLAKAGIDSDDATGAASADGELPFDEWVAQIRGLFDDYPCIREICEPHPERLWPFLLFASAALMGTLMTLTWFRFYDQPEKRRRLNYNVLGIGDPACGKGALVRIAALLTEPIDRADQMANDAINEWKAQQRSKGANKDKLLRPNALVRLHGARTSNNVFINDMINAMVEVGDERMQVHMLTVDTEALNSIKMQKGGSWIDKQVMEIKAWSNEKDSQQYANLDSITGFFNVVWNLVRTCTPPALKLLANEHNFGTGWPTRVSAIPILGTGFKMIELRRQSQEATAADEVLRQWAYRLDKRQGELPLWPLVEHAWHWTANRMEIAAFNDDKADELLLKRCAANALCICAPFVDMRHWDEREKNGSYETDERDSELHSLILDIQYRTQHYYFGALARNYFEEQMVDATKFRRRTTRFEQCYQRLPQEFTTEQFAQTFGYANVNSAAKALNRFLNDKTIVRTKRGEYRKRVQNIS